MIESNEPAVEPHEALLRLSAPSMRLNTKEQSHVHKLAALAACFLRTRVVGFLLQHGHSPIAVSYQSDCTPETTFERITALMGDQRIVRGGRRVSEFLLDRVFVLAASGHRSALFRPPLRMADKTAWCHLAAAEDVLFYGFKNGCTSINIFHVVVDGAVFLPFSDLLHRHFHQALDAHCSPLPRGEATLCRLSSLFAATLCAIMHLITLSNCP